MITITRLMAFTLMFVLLGGCQKPETTTSNSSSPASTSAEATAAQEKPATNESETAQAEWVACPEQRPEMCIQIYQPVCATIDTGVRCVTTPCPSHITRTLGNACSACSDENVVGYYSGECPAEEETGQQ